jgi:hypothetical protein
MFARAAAFAPALQSNWQHKPLPIIGPSSQGEAGKLGPQRSINFYPVKPEREGDPWQLRGTPGLALLGTLPRTRIRGVIVHKDRLFALAGPRIYEVYATGTYREWGVISSTRGKVTMASLLNIIVIGDGSGYYALDLDAETVSRITDAPRGRFCVFFNQRILYQGESGQVFYSEVNDPANIPGLNFFTAESLPDEIAAIVTTEDQVWLLGGDSAEPWYDSGDVDNPYARIQGGVVYSGCGHPDTALRVDNSVWWVERDKEGTGIVRRSQGFTPTRISTTAVERFTASATNLSAFSYQEQGETFYCINADEGSWAYAIKAGEWCERAWLNRETGEQERQRQEFHAYAYGLHMVFDYESGKVYRQGLDLYSDAGQEIRSTRVSQIISFNGRPVSIGELWVDFAAGVGLDGSGQGTDPEVMLRCSRDGSGFDNERVEPLGAIGEYGAQVRFFDLGQGRNWCFEISVSDPVLKGLLGAEAKLKVGRR